MRRAFKYRIYPTKAQISILEYWLELCRELYNSALQERRDAYRISKVSINFVKQSCQLPGIKQERPEFLGVFSQVLQNVLRRVEFTFDRFFSRVKLGLTPGYPRFKGRDRYNSLTWPQAQGFRILGTKRIYLGNFGEIKIKLHRPIGGIPKTCTIKREAGKWFAVFSCDKVAARIYPVSTSEIGIDMGLKNFATFSTGEKIENPRWYRKTETRLNDSQRDLSRKKYGSNRRAKAKRRLGRLYARASNQRKDFHHKLAYRITSENAAIFVEDLSVKEMIEKSSSGLSKSIWDAGAGRFLSILGAKAEEAARRFVKVPPRGTTSTCSRCGAVKHKMLRERLHSCPCGLVIDRDINASFNILRLGRSLQRSIG